jgi:hypothetical protein
MTCKKCKVAMKELKGHIFHGNRKWRCPQCQKIKMQKPKSKSEAHGDRRAGPANGNSEAL